MIPAILGDSIAFNIPYDLADKKSNGHILEQQCSINTTVAGIPVAIENKVPGLPHAHVVNTDVYLCNPANWGGVPPIYCTDGLSIFTTLGEPEAVLNPENLGTVGLFQAPLNITINGFPVHPLGGARTCGDRTIENTIIPYPPPVPLLRKTVTMNQ